jgi:hypothetical protein
MTTTATRRPGRPETGRGTKIGLYLSQERLRKLGRNPAQTIYSLIDAAVSLDDSIQVFLRLTPDQIAAIGASDEETARSVLMKTVDTLARRKR